MRFIYCCLICCLLPAGLYARRPSSGRNIIAAGAAVNNAGFGPALSYTRFTGAGRKLAWKLPVCFCFDRVPRNNSHGLTAGRDRWPMMTFIMPGVLFYPTGSTGVARYAIGADLLLGVGKGRSGSYSNGTNELTARTIAGGGIEQVLHLQITPGFYTGISLLLGSCTDDGFNSAAKEKLNPLYQLSLSFGCRW